MASARVALAVRRLAASTKSVGKRHMSGGSYEEEVGARLRRLACVAQPPLPSSRRRRARPPPNVHRSLACAALSARVPASGNDQVALHHHGRRAGVCVACRLHAVQRRAPPRGEDCAPPDTALGFALTRTRTHAHAHGTRTRALTALNRPGVPLPAHPQQAVPLVRKSARRFRAPAARAYPRLPCASLCRGTDFGFFEVPPKADKKHGHH